jgi:hypothetical protein
MAAFEWISCLDKGGRISYEHCKVLTMLIQALPFTFDSGPNHTRSEIFQDGFQRQKTGAKVTGMGLGDTMAVSGYAWFPLRIAWEQFQFHSRFDSSMVFNNSMLRDTYRKNWKGVKDAKDDLGRLEATDSWLRLYKDDPQCLAWIEGYLLYFLMQSYRKEVFRYWKDLVRPEFEKKASQGEIGLYYASIQEHFKPESISTLHIIEPRRTKTKTIEDLVFFLWDDRLDDELDRGRWEDAPFRIFARRAINIITEHCGKAARHKFRDDIKRYFIATHWLFPQPTQTKFVQRGKGKQIQCIAVYHLRLAFSRRFHNTTVNPSFTYQLSQQSPTLFRPKREESYIKLREENAYMPDWRMVDGGKGPLMNQDIAIEEEDGLLYSSGLLEIQGMLDLKWRAWRQIEDMVAEQD